MYVIKKDLTKQEFDIEKVKTAITKSAYRVMAKLTDEQMQEITKRVEDKAIEIAGDTGEIQVATMHNLVELALDDGYPNIAKSYRDYRNYKTSFVDMLDEVYQKSQSIMYIGDKENSNTDSALVSTKRSLIFNKLNKEFYRKFFLTTEMLQACNDGYIYIHDMVARRDTYNCCIFDVKNVLDHGFEMGNIWYNEPKTLDTAFDVIGDIVLSAASQQYGGFTISRLDEILDKYAQKSYDKYYKEIACNYIKLSSEKELNEWELEEQYEKFTEEGTRFDIDSMAYAKVERDMMQGFQGFEYKFNTVASSRGDYPFITITVGVGTSRFAKLATTCCLRVRRKGQGKPGYEKQVLFPKIVFTYTEDLHGPGKINEDLFEEGILCSAKGMYPDWLSLDGPTTISEMWHKYGEVIAPMGCVQGDEVVTYKIFDKLYVESISRMWERLTTIFYPKFQKNGEPHKYMDVQNVKIHDIKNGFVDVTRMVRNVSNDWMKITFSNGRSIECTSDHPFPIEGRGRIFARDLLIGDRVTIIKTQYSEEIDELDPDEAWCLGALLYGDDFYDDYKLTATQFKLKKEVFSKHLVELFGSRTKEKRHIPQEIFRASKRSKLAFIGGMIDAGGGIDSRNGTHMVQLTAPNKEVALQQMALLQSVGIGSNICEKYEANCSTEIIYFVEGKLVTELLDHIATITPKTYRIDPARDAELTEDIDIGIVSKIEHIADKVDFSYDVTTESDHFDVSGIYSHNCRAFLSTWYERGGMYPEDDDDRPVFTGRFNLGVVSLHLPMILAKSRKENRDFYEVLDYYLELIREVHKKTFEYLGEFHASISPLAYCEGGLYGGNLNPHDKIKPMLKACTASYGITALNELNRLYNGKSIAEDGEFPLEVMQYINDKLAKYKKEDGILYAVYGTPAESLCGTQVIQFRKMYGIIENVSDKDYMSNSFHCHVSEDITGEEKQDLEYRFWDLFGGGRIGYVKYPIDYNLDAFRTYIRRAMEKGIYEGVNLSLGYCDDCGHSFTTGAEVCPKCGSKNLTKIDRMNGYLSYSRVKGDSRLNDAKMAEIADRKSM